MIVYPHRCIPAAAPLFSCIFTAISRQLIYNKVYALTILRNKNNIALFHKNGCRVLTSKIQRQLRKCVLLMVFQDHEKLYFLIFFYLNYVLPFLFYCLLLQPQGKQKRKSSVKKIC